MPYLLIIGEFFANPYESFRKYKGQHLYMSIVLGMLLSTRLLFLMAWQVDSLARGLLLVLATAIVNVVTSVLLIHCVCLFFGGEGKWQELLSLYGFTSLPLLLPAIVTIVSFSLNVPSYRSPVAPGIITLAASAVMPMAYFEMAMKIAAYIYGGLAISAVYKLKWSKVVACVVASILTGTILGSTVSGLVLPFRNLPWVSTALMLENVTELHLSLGVNTAAVTTTPVLEAHELVLAQPKDMIYLRTADSANTYVRGAVLGELVGMPGDRVALDEGTLYVNGEVLTTPAFALPHLTLAELTLGEGQYFIYFSSPMLLGTETRPESFVLTSERILRGVSPKSLAFLRWLTR